MSSPEGVDAFRVTGAAYDTFMGRYSQPLANGFADAAGVAPGQDALDAGCGPGALTGVLVDRLGAGSVSAFDPSPPFVAECAARHPGVTVRQGRVEQIPYGDQTFDVVLAQLVLHFVSDPARCAAEFRRVLRPGGVAGACVWDFDGGMEMLHLFWAAALAVDQAAPAEARDLPFGSGAGQLAGWLTGAGFADVDETVLEVGTTYASFDELWAGFLGGVGPAGAYCVGLAEEQRLAVRDGLFLRLGSPVGSFILRATARCGLGRLR